MWWRRDKKAKTADAGPGPGESAVRGAPRFLDPEVLARIGSLELLARAVVEGFIAGLHRSPFTGFSTEFTEYRQYNPGDDLRYLDWRLLGRTDRFFIKKYRADTNAQFTLLVDTSGSMRYSGRAGGETRLSEALHLTADRLTRRGVVVLVSDFYESPERLAGAFQHLRFRGHDVIAFHVPDRRAVEFDFEASLLPLED